MPRVITEELYQSLVSDYRTLLEKTTNEDARTIMKKRIEKLEVAPAYRKGQVYSD